MRKRWTVLAVLAACLLPLSGCRLRADVGIAVDGDGAGRLAYTLTADDELRADARRAGADPVEALVGVGAGLDGWEVTRRTSGPLRGVTLSTAFDDPAELARVSGQVAEALAAPELRPLGPLRLDLADDTVELLGSAGLVLDEAAVRELGVRPARARAVLADNVALRVEARMPGEVLETDADDRDGDRTVAWTIAPGQQRTLRVVARRPWTLARLSRVLITAPGMLALAIGIALIYAGRRTALDDPRLPVA